MVVLTGSGYVGDGMVGAEYVSDGVTGVMLGIVDDLVIFAGSVVVVAGMLDDSVQPSTKDINTTITKAKQITNFLTPHPPWRIHQTEPPPPQRRKTLSISGQLKILLSSPSAPAR